MNILYVSSACSISKYNELFSKSEKKPAVQAIKFNRLIVEGLSRQEGIKVECLSKLPINKESYNKNIYYGEKEKNKNVSYRYIPIINNRIMNNLITAIYSFFYCILFALKNKDSILIIDVLNVSLGLGASMAYKIVNKQIIGIITDLPKYFGGNKVQKCINKIINRCSKYILMTEEMNDIVNKNKKKNIVIEGMSDIEMIDKNKIDACKYSERVIVYAGSFDKRFGILKLLNAFTKVEGDDVRLWIFGRGDAESEIIEQCEKDKRIYFGGMRLNEEILEIESKATLLVNPRPSDEEMTKYSFPSKTMEYMSTGTPVLTTKLKGIPDEYDEYLYYFDDETIEGIARRLEEVISLPRLTLNEKGEKARKFVLDKKNNLIQAKKILNMIN